ncbi:DinB family protein [Larkinella arboricola]|uniref:DinB family protein n=1 Tax=Larkinella arboricola TaxID=643671 RepID=A0A327X1U2_LARAB|nr:DinB family protein [Larkinella arboricola]RAK00090.1 DinB family protein [Larkinella arboricola]
MPTFTANVLLDQLTAETHALIQLVENEFSSLPNDTLNWQPAPERWSILQCLEHLNSYGHYYLPQLEKAVYRGEQEQIAASTSFRSGLLGNYFATSMRPKADGSIGLKAKAVKAHTPAARLDARAVLTTFLDQQRDLLNLLERARRVNIERFRVPISIARFIRLSVGDTFRFLIAHEQRHVLQAQRVAAEAKLCAHSSIK